MQCSDLRDLAGTCLSDDSMITSNHEALAHLERCDECLRELAARWNLRATLRTAALQAPALQLSDEVAARLRARVHG